MTQARNLKTLCATVAVILIAGFVQAQVSIGGFIPYVGIGLTEEFETIDQDQLYNFADPATSPGGSFLNNHFEIALLDTGAATHIITDPAYNAFDLEASDLDGTGVQVIGGATGQQLLQINNPLGFYSTGLGKRTSQGASLGFNANDFRGQTSTAILSAPTTWELPNIVGLPMAAQHSIAIRNDQPQIFSHQFEGESRTVRTPEVIFGDLGVGGAGAGPGNSDIIRRTDLTLKTGIGFIQGPFYVPNLDIGLGLDLNFHRNPQSPTVIENGGLFIEVDMDNGNGDDIEDKEFLFDTGADFTVISERTAARLGFDPILDKPDFLVEVEGSGGIVGRIPGVYVEQLNLDTVGGSFTLQNVPVAVLDVTNPSDPGNIVDGILGMHLFNGHNIVIDANPSTGVGGTGPSLFISEKVTTEFHWANEGPSGNWSTVNEWQQNQSPSDLTDAQVIAIGGDRTAIVSSSSTVYRATVGGQEGAKMTVHIQTGETLTTFGETKIDEGGQIELLSGKLNAQFINIEEGGILSGGGDVFSGTGPIRSPVRTAGRIEVGYGSDNLSDIDTIAIDGDLSVLETGVVAIDLGGTTAGSQHDLLDVTRNAFLSGTLEVNLLSGYSPIVGDTFTLLTAGNSITGTFDNKLLPSGFLWDVQYNATSVVLEVTGIGLEGDFDGNGTVDAADYTIWRDGLGTTYTQADYQLWVNNYGMTLPASSSASAIPEPTGVAMVSLALILFATRSQHHIRQ